MTVSTITGLADDSDILANERVIDMDNTISMLDPDTSQFTTMLMKIGSTPAFSSKVEWLEDQLFPRLTTVNGSQTSGDTSLEVATGTGAYLRAGDLLRNARTGEGILVTSMSTDTATVTRGHGRVTAASMNDGDQLLIVGNAAAQAATLGTRKQTKRVAQYNYTQIVRNPYGFSRTLTQSKLYGGPALDKERQKKLVEHKRAIEYILFWGMRGDNPSSDSVPGECGGLFEFVTTNVKDAAGSLTKSLLDTYMQDLLQHGNKNKVFFVSPTISRAISGFLRDAWFPNTTDARLWGAYVDGFISGAYGTRVPVVVKRDWNDFATTSSQYGGWGFLVDMENVQLRPLQATQLLKDRQANDADSKDEEYLAELSFQVEQELTHGLVIGVTG